MSTLEQHYQARYDAQGEGGQSLQSDLKLLAPQDFVDAYGAAHEAQFGSKPPLPSFLPSEVKPDTPAPTFMGADIAGEKNTPRRYVAAAMEGVLMGGKELGRTANEVAEFAAQHSDVLNTLVHPFGGPPGSDAPPAALLPDKSTSESIVGALAQFAAPYSATVKAFDGLQLFKAFGKAAPLIKDAAATVPTDFAAFDPQSNNIVDTLNETAKAHGFKGQVGAFLRSTPGDVDAETQLLNRVKAAVSNIPVNTALGFGIGKLQEGAVKAYMIGAKAARALVHANGQEAVSKAVQEAPNSAIARGALGLPAAPKSFTTAKGSTYTLNPDGTTLRNKAARDDPDHAGDSGVKPVSERTVFVTPEDARLLGEVQTRSAHKRAIALSGDGAHAAVKYLDGPSGGKVEQRTIVPVQDIPAVGLVPLELWKGGRTHHFGNVITSVSK